jgi:hypothetical protein
MRILAIISGDYGRRHVDNIQARCPREWSIETWQAPAVLPPVIDYPEEYLPDAMPPADLILSFAEHKGVAELLPDIADRTGAQAVIAAVDNESWLPRGLARQLRGWLQAMGVAVATPKPLCALTDSSYKIGRRQTLPVTHPLIAEFAQNFGQPSLALTVDPQTRQIVTADVVRDAVCGCARYAAERLVGVSADEAGERAGLLHHHYPCLASMGVDSDYGDTLMHISGNLLKDHVEEQVRSFKMVQRITPHGLVQAD